MSAFTDFLGGIGPALGLLGGGAAAKGAYDRLGEIGDVAQQGAMQIAQSGLDQTKFQPFSVTSATGGQFGYNPQTGAATLAGSPQEQAIQSMLMNQAQSAFGATPYGQMAGRAAADQAYGMGNQFMQSAQTQPSDLNQLRGQFANQVSGQLGQQPSAALGQFGQQALGLGSQGLATQAPSDVEALRSQYGQLAGQAAGNVLGSTAGREADVYSRIRATQRPEEERQRMALEERLFNQGRSGVSTNMYGGTPEQLAMAKAQEEAQNTASLAAIQQAQAEQQQALGTAQTLGGMFGQQAGLSGDIQSQAQTRAAQLATLGLSANQIQSQLQTEGLGRATTSATQASQLAGMAGDLQQQQAALGTGMIGLGSELTAQDMALLGAQQNLGLGALGGSYVPQAQLLAAMQGTDLYPQLQQRGQLYGSGLFGEGAMGGLEALLGAGLGQANLMGQLGTGLIGGLSTPTDSFGGLSEVFGGAFEGLGGLFGSLLGSGDGDMGGGTNVNNNPYYTGDF